MHYSKTLLAYGPWFDRSCTVSNKLIIMRTSYYITRALLLRVKAYGHFIVQLALSLTIYYTFTFLLRHFDGI